MQEFYWGDNIRSVFRAKWAQESNKVFGSQRLVNGAQTSVTLKLNLLRDDKDWYLTTNT